MAFVLTAAFLSYSKFNPQEQNQDLKIVLMVSRGLRRKGREGSETYVAHSLASMDLMMYSPVPKVYVQRVKLKEENQCNM